MVEISAWRRRWLQHLEVTLIGFELALSVIFFVVSILAENVYLKGVGIGLTIAWVTSAIAVLFRRLARVTT